MSDIVTLAMTGASGAQYGLRLLECLVAADKTIFFMVSRAAQVVLETETPLVLRGSTEEIQHTLEQYTHARSGQIRVFSQEDWMSPVASGSGAPSSKRENALSLCRKSGIKSLMNFRSLRSTYFFTLRSNEALA